MQPDKKDLELFKKWVSESSHIVFLGGAGEEVLLISEVLTDCTTKNMTIRRKQF